LELGSGRDSTQQHSGFLLAVLCKHHSTPNSGRVLSPTRSGVLVQRATNPRRLPTWSLRAFTEAAASIATLYRQIVKLARDRGEQAPSYGTVFNIVRSLPADLVTLAHEVTKAYSNTFELVHRREAERPNSIWQADHTPLDILLVRPDGRNAKPWLTTVIDDYSRAIAGYFLSFEDPSIRHTSLVLRQAIWRKQEPRWIVCGISLFSYSD
jgi:putative transposase